MDKILILQIAIIIVLLIITIIGFIYWYKTKPTLDDPNKMNPHLSTGILFGLIGIGAITGALSIFTLMRATKK